MEVFEVTNMEGVERMSKEQLVTRYTELARRKTELLMHTGSHWNPEYVQEEKAILQEMAVLETAIKLPADEQTVPEMVTIRQASARTGLSYDYIRKLCIQKKIVFVKVGTKYLVNMSKLIAFLNGGAQEEVS